MKTTDIIKMIKADIDRNEQDIENLRIKLIYSYALLDRIERKAVSEKQAAPPELRKETF